MFDYPDRRLDAKGGWVRVRDEGDRVTMSYKQAPKGSGVRDCFETELVIDVYERGVEFCKDLGLEQKSYQETKRESWTLDGVHFDIDTWPGIPTFIEVEANDQATVHRYVEALGCTWADARFGGVAVLYHQFLGIPEHEVNHIPEITFAHPPTAR